MSIGSLLLPLPAIAVAPVNPGWLARSWQTDDGLPDNNVTGVAQTSDGYLWVATAGGLMRFDGARFQEIPLADLNGVPNRVVRAMTLDRRGRLWLGMNRGPIVRLAASGVSVFTNRLPDAQVAALAEDGADGVWIAYSSGRVARLGADGEVSFWGPAQGLPAGGVCHLALDTKDRLWFAKGRSVGVFDDGKFQVLLNGPGVVGSIATRHAGGIWVCAGSHVLAYDGQQTEWATLPPGVNGGDVTALFEDRSGALWVGTAAAGLFRDQGAGMGLMPTSHPNITSLMEDAEGNLWAGSAGGGLNRLRPRVIELLGAGSGLPFESARSLCEDASGTVWVALENGALVCRRDGIWINEAKQANWPDVHATCVAAVPAREGGGIWLGTRNGGLWRLEKDQWRAWHTADGLASETVRSLCLTAAGELWLTTDAPARLQRWRDNHFDTFRLPSPTRSLRAMTVDAAGNIWVGSADGQLFQVRDDHVSNETAIAGPRLLSIRCLTATPDGAVWIGYAGWGIGRIHNGHYARLTREQGLPDDYISQMAADNHGWLWCAGNGGIFQVRLDELNAVLSGRAGRVAAIVRGRAEGLSSLQPNYDYGPGVLRAPDGRLWFPMKTGLAVVAADSTPRNRVPPPVWIERVAVDGRTVAPEVRRRSPGSALTGQAEISAILRRPPATLRLAPAYRKLDLEFTALSFTAPENVRFQYRLAGFDEDWMETETRHVNYPRLPAGEYQFRVKACNNDGVWNDDGATLNLIVLPFFWQTWWFGALATAALTGGLIAVVRYVSFRRLRRQLRRLEQQAALHRERARIARDIHDDLGADLTQISLMGELARQDSVAGETALQRINKISATARQAIKSLDEIVWAVNPRNDTLTHLMDYTGQFALDYLRVAGIRCRLDFPDQPPSREISTDLRHNLFLAVKETLHNIVKHAHASEVRLRVQTDETVLRVVIEDNGRGFAEAPDNALADGLRNLQQRLAEIHGVCRIESRVDAGTTVIFEVPWPAQNEK